MAKYPPLFKRVLDQPTPKGEQIAEIQMMYERFWAMLNPLLPANSEKTLAMRSLQESCMWMTRASAIAIWYELNPESAPQNRLKKPKPINPLYKRAYNVNEKNIGKDSKIIQKPHQDVLNEPPRDNQTASGKQYGPFDLSLNEKSQKEANISYKKHRHLIKPLIPGESKGMEGDEGPLN